MTCHSSSLHSFITFPALSLVQGHNIVILEDLNYISCFELVYLLTSGIHVGINLLNNGCSSD